MMRNGAEMLIEALKREGVEVIFGFPGGVVIPVFDALYSEPAIKVVLTRHEQAAVHAADGYARSTGKTGVCLVTSGPGATNTATGLATANFDSVPIVCITGQVPLNMIGNDAFQEADTIGITRPITKHNYLVTERSELAATIKKAFIIAGSGRPGPVVIDLPKDIIVGKLDEEYPDEVKMRGYNPVLKGHIGQIKKAAELLAKAKRPLFYVGGGIQISGAAPAFRKVVKKTGVPVISSLMGIGAIESDHPLNLGMLGMHGTYAANMAVTECDLIFGVGTRFDDRATGKLESFAPHATIIHADIDPSAIARNVPVEIPIVGDAALVLEDLLPFAKPPSIDPWVKLVSGWKEEHPVVPEKSRGRLSPGVVVKKISEVFPEAIIATEVGQNQMWAALFYNYTQPRTLITSGGLGTMGYGFPAAIGVKIAHPDKTVIDIAGDGSIQMNIQEMATAVQEGLAVIIAVLNNGYLGMVRQWQELFYGKRYSGTCLKRRPECPEQCSNPGDQCLAYVPDFVKLAEAYDSVGIRVTKEEEIVPALKRAAEVKDRPVIIDFIIDEEANVWPMVPAGGANKDMLLGGVK
ncbi:MAG: biosynthetic-type acetolactate synthase large subunit [Spirochaetales bacterium]|nr:biosynthetic-type acetolactate synthase large subunit [Spirochaetales bacterium]